MFKINFSTLLFGIAVLVAVATIFVLQQHKFDRAIAVERAIKDFGLAQVDQVHQPYDSVYAEEQRVRFYKQGVLVGTSVITIE